ncbi:beta-1,4-N-acetylgalactosaminyltransferase bre-4 [Dermacentor silvarum]|uniref:beta-1,4-N-acetylgalactosaminyltransferase bre-4 n=1 Tax=Dermacentor silvarum TaxID=543639 RepID=UPI002100A927|nr:beta-1,4-N-acetylgalactosaminyltransferase bre-4 [Dermacentor silvarum]
MRRHHLLCLVTGYMLLFLLVMHFFGLSTVRRKASNIATRNIYWVSSKLKISGQELFSLGNVKKAENGSDVFRIAVVNSSALNKSTRERCPITPPNLVGDLPVKWRVPSLDVMHKEFPHVTEGGRFAPKECTSRHRVAILVPYRDRAVHLKFFLFHMHRLLSRQQIDYGIFIIEQADKSPFNRAKLFNVGFVESTALYDYQCFVFHDVDLLPIDDRNLYTCPTQPRHMCVTIDGESGVFYRQIFGGVTAMTKEHFLRVNGYSNMYWGWGAEDDDMFKRLSFEGLMIYRRSPDVARYTSLLHVHTTITNNRSLELLEAWDKRDKTDGLNSLVYERLHISFEKLYTWLKVDLKEGN